MQSAPLIDISIANNDLGKFDPRYFAMLHAAVAIVGHDELEAGHANEVLEYYTYLLNLNIPNCPASLQLNNSLNKKPMDDVNWHMQKMREIDTKISKYIENQKSLTLMLMKGVMNHINECCDITDVCYLASGWVSSRKTDGHFAGLKIRKMPDGQFAVSVINHGAGIQYHTVLGQSGFKIKRSYQSDEFILDLTTSDGRDCIRQILELRYLIPPENSNSYSEDDLYGLLMVYGKHQPLTDKLSEKSVTSQRSGTCSVTNMNAVARDILVDHNVGFDQRKRYQFIIKLKSLIEGFNQFKQGKYQLAVVEWALHEFSVRILKNRHLLTDEEMTYCTELQVYIQNELDTAKRLELKQKTVSKPFPDVTGPSVISQPKPSVVNIERIAEKEPPVNELSKFGMGEVKIADLIKLVKYHYEELKGDSSDIRDKYALMQKSLKLNPDLKPIYNDKNHVNRFASAEVTPETLGVNLRSNVYQISFLEFPESVHQAYRILNELPHVTGNATDPFWDKVPEQDIPLIINELNRLVGRLEGNQDSPPLIRSQAFAAALLVYDIVAKLSQRMPSLFHLGEQLSFGLDDVYSKESFYIDPECFYTIKRIEENFTKRAEGKKRVFTNSVVEGSTIDYLINVILDPKQRQLLAGYRDHSVELTHKPKYTDKELFETLMYARRYNQLPIGVFIPESIDSLLQISCVTHRLGNSDGYFKDQYEPFYLKFDLHSRANCEEERAGVLSGYQNGARQNKRQTLSPVPSIGKNLEGLTDISENTVFYPIVPLKKIRDEERVFYEGLIDKYNSKEFITDSPYQPLQSGSIKPDSKPWNKDEVDHQLIDELNEALCQIGCTPNLQIERSLAWVASHPQYLQFPGVKRTISNYLFEYGKLDQALSSQPRVVISLFHDVLIQFINYYQSQQIQDPALLVWMENLSYHLRNYIEVAAKLYHFDLSQQSLPSLRPLLISQLKNTVESDERSLLASQIIQSYRSQQHIDLDDLCQILASRIVAKLGANDAICEEQWNRRAKDVLKNVIEHPDVAMQLLHKHLDAFGVNQQTLKWRFQKGTMVSDSGFKIDLLSGELRDSSGVSTKDRTNKVFKDNAELFKSIHLSSATTTILQGFKNSLFSADGTWRFQFNLTPMDDATSRYEIKEVFQNILINGENKQYKLIQAKDLEDVVNPFDSFETDKFYEYWQCVNEYGLFLVRDKSERELAYELNFEADQRVVQLKLTNQNAWHPTNRIMLNLAEPKTSLEKAWQERLDPLFGIKNVRLMANLTDDDDSCTIDRIEHLPLGLNFNVDAEKQLASEEFPGFHISPILSIPQLHGIPNVLILENMQKQQKFILPAYKLKKHSHNAMFDTENIVNYEEFCNDSIRYYTYTLDDKHKLVGASVEANLYMAIILRSKGDFKEAIYYLDLCRTFNTISHETLNIAQQIVDRRMQSAHGAAFDLKLEAFIKEQSNKWDRRLAPIATSEVEKKKAKRKNKYLHDQVHLYTNSLSLYKTGVSIIPEYLKVTEREMVLLDIKEKKYQQEKKSKVKSEVLHYSLLELERFSNLIHEYDRLLSDDDLENTLKNLRTLYTTHENLDVFSPHTYKFRLNIDNETARTNYPSFYYTLSHLHEYFRDAVSKDQSRVLKLRSMIFRLMQNDKKYSEDTCKILSVILAVSIQPNLFSDVSIPEDPVDFFRELVMVAKYQNYDLYEDLGLLDHKIVINPREIVIEKPLPSDLTSYKIPFSFNVGARENECKSPFVKLAVSYFSAQKRPIAKGEFHLQETDLGRDASAIEKRLLAQYVKGHQENKERYKTVYSFNSSTDLLNLKAELNTSIADDEKALQSIVGFLKKANHTPLDDENASATDKSKALALLHARATGLKHEIKIEHLFAAFLQKDPSLLTEQNPYLTENDIKKLFADLADYALLHSRMDQAKEALEIIGQKKLFNELAPYQLQLLAYTLAKERSYDVHQYPELLVYEYAVHKVLRDDQIKTLFQIFELLEGDSPEEFKHALLQFAAGGGKTSVLIPILAQRIAQKGLLPVIFNTNELYQIGMEEIPKNLHLSFGQKIEVIERELNHQWTVNELKKLLADLTLWQKQGKCLLLKPVTWHSINIARKLSRMNGDDLWIAKLAEDVLDFFKTKTVKLEDESQIISDPMLLCIKTTGAMIKVPFEQINIIQHCYKQLFEDEKISTLAGIKDNRKRAILASELTELKNSLAEKLCHFEVLTMVNAGDLQSYLTQNSTMRPEWLKQLYMTNKKIANSVVCARAFLQTHLPHILSMQHLKDFGPSIHQDDLTAAPKHEGKDVHAHFADYTLVTALTIQMYRQRGLAENHVVQLLNHLIKLHENERIWNRDLRYPTEIENYLLQIIPVEYQFTSIQDLNKSMIVNLSKDESVKHNTTAIEIFLKQFALPQIQMPSQKQSSTAAELQAGFNRSVLFSATPGLREVYPVYLKPINCHLQESFEAQVIETLFDDANAGVCQLDACQSPADFFKQLPPEKLTRMTTLIDRGALFTDFDPSRVISDYLELGLATPTKTAAYFAKEQMVIAEMKETNIEENAIKGSGLIEELKRKGIKPEEFLLFLFLDLSKTTGTDIKRPFKDHAGLTVGQTQTVTETIQAAMRERQLLDENAQSITWVMFKSLYQQITGTDQFDPKKLFYWLIKNEANQIHSKLIHRAYQGINQIIEDLAWHYLAENSNDVDMKKALTQERSLDAYFLYELEYESQGTEKVLNAYVQHLVKDVFHFSNKKISLSAQDWKRINQLINETAHLIPLTEQPQATQLNAEVVQEFTVTAQNQQAEEQQQQQQHKLMNQNSLATDFKFMVEKYDYAQDNLQGIFNPENKKYQPLLLPKTGSIKQPHLLFCRDHLQAIHISGSAKKDEIEQLKPIKLMLVKINPDKSMQFCACSAAGGEYYRSLIDNETSDPNKPTYLLVTNDGKIVNHSKNIQIHQCQQAIETQSCQKMLAYVNFLNGKMTDPYNLSLIAKEYRWSKGDYQALVKAVYDVQLTQSIVSLSANTAFEILCGWQEVTVNRTLQRYKQQGNRTQLPIVEQPLRPAVSLANHMDTTTKPIIVPERALEGFVFGIQPKEVRHVKEDNPIQYRIERFKQIYNSNIPGKAQAIERFLQAAMAVQLIQGIENKIKALDQLYDNYVQLDRILESLYKQIQPYKDMNELKSSVALISNVIEQIVSTFGPETSIETCKDELMQILDKVDSTLTPLCLPSTAATQSTNSSLAESPTDNFVKLIQQAQSELQSETLSTTVTLVK